MLQNIMNDFGLGNEADDFHFVAALGAGQRIYFPNLFDTSSPQW